MPKYFVIWEIELDADSPAEAAIYARKIQLDPLSLATHFHVIDENEPNRVICVEAIPSGGSHAVN